MTCSARSFGMRAQFADARRLVVARQARARAGDRAGLRHAATHLHQALRRGADHRPPRLLQQAGKRRRIGPAQDAHTAPPAWAPARTVPPGAREVHLEDVAGVQVLVDARHAIEEQRSAHPRTRLSAAAGPGSPARQRDRLPVGRASASWPASATRIVHSPQVVDDHRGRAAHGQRQRQRLRAAAAEAAARSRPPAHRPATAPSRHGTADRRPRRAGIRTVLPGGVQRIEESVAGHDAHPRITQPTIGVQGQAVAREREQDVVARLRACRAPRFRSRHG